MFRTIPADFKYTTDKIEGTLTTALAKLPVVDLKTIDFKVAEIEIKEIEPIIIKKL